MLKNYLKTAWRSLLRNKSYTIINITGLGIGIAACLLIFLVVNFETSFDDYHAKKDRIYRVITERHTPDGIKYKGGVPMPVAPALRVDYAQLPQVASVFNNYNLQMNVADEHTGQVKKFNDDDVYFAEPQMFKIFDFEWLGGDKQSALTEPNTVILSQRIAEKYFGKWQAAIGKTVRCDNAIDLKVTGVLKNHPNNTDLPIDIAVSYSTIKNTGYSQNLTDWGSNLSAHNCFIVLPDKVSAAGFNSFLNSFVKKYKPEKKNQDFLKLQAFTDMHYDSKVPIFSGQVFSKDLIKTISLIGVFLLVIACVNFINLATAQAVNRSKEVGIRKVLGSGRRQLILQFISETFIITLISVGLGIALSEAALPSLNNLLEVKLNANFLANTNIVLFLVAVVIGVTLLSGLYPAVVLSGFNPIAALKNKISTTKSNGITLRRSLVVLQFGIAQVLVIATIVVINQLDHFKNSSLGFDKNAVITVPLPSDSVSRLKLTALHNQIIQQPGVEDFSLSYGSPSDDKNWGTSFNYNDAAESAETKASLKWADAEYFKLYGMAFVAGRPYIKSDTLREFVVNEAMVKSLGVKDAKDVIGKNISIWGERVARIVGVVKDFNTVSLRDQVPPVIMGAWKDQYELANIKLKPANIKQTLANIEHIWSGTFPDNIYEYKFLDDKIADFYKKEDQLSQLYKIFAGIAIFISCLGLYGMVSFMAVQRTKEVGIRKTLGASVGNIVYLFSKEFTLLIVVAFVIAAPLAWYFMQQWLQGFTYRIKPGAGIFVLTISLSIIIAWLTVGYKAITAALVNPVKSLKSE
jgi:putative ABC transport system permease protein